MNKSAVRLAFSGMHTQTACFPGGGVSSRALRDRGGLTGGGEVNRLPAAGVVLTSSDSWDASSCSTGSNFRDLGHIKIIF